MATETNRGQRLDLVLIKGKTFERFFQSNAINVDDDGTEVASPLPISSGTLRAQARKKLADTVAALTFTVSVHDGPNGIWRLLADAATTAAMVGGRNEDDPKAFYEQWDVEFQYSDGRVIELYYGELRVLGEATR